MSASPPEDPARDSGRSEPAAKAPGPAAAPRSATALRAAGPALATAVFAAALVAWQWHDGRTERAALRQDLAKKLADADTQGRHARTVAEQAREAVADAHAKLGVLEGRLGESQSQQIALEALYQELSRNRDEWAYAEIEQSLFIATQQLTLAGNVKAALIALQAADARLQRLDRPHLTALRKAINRDIERLKAAPHVDTVAISVRLDSLAAQVERFPLAIELRSQAAEERERMERREDEGGLLARFWREAWAELRQLVRVQPVAQPQAPLLAPGQSYFLRENLRLRLLGARLALLSRDAESYKTDLAAARDWLKRYYDTRHNGVAQAINVLRNLHDAEVGIEPPEITGTLEAMRVLRTSRERGAR